MVGGLNVRQPLVVHGCGAENSDLWIADHHAPGRSAMAVLDDLVLRPSSRTRWSVLAFGVPGAAEGESFALGRRMSLWTCQHS